MAINKSIEDLLMANELLGTGSIANEACIVPKNQESTAKDPGVSFPPLSCRKSDCKKYPIKEKNHLNLSVVVPILCCRVGNSGNVIMVQTDFLLRNKWLQRRCEF